MPQQPCASELTFHPTASGGRAKSSAFVGRIGALALFMGVGAALAVPAVAQADTEGSSDSSASSASISSGESGTAGPSKKSRAESTPHTAERSDGDTGDTNEADDADGADVEASDVESDYTDGREQADRVDEADDNAVDTDTDSSVVTADEPEGAPEVVDVDTSPTPDTEATAETETVAVTSVSDLPSGTAPTSPLQAPSPLLMAAYSRREVGEDTPAEAATTIAATLVDPAATPAAPSWNFPILTAVRDLLFTIAPYTVLAADNVARMVVETPMQTLLHPFTSAAFAISTLTRGVLTDIGVLPKLAYADTGWVTLHGNPANQKEQLGVDAAQEYSRWEALLGAAILAAPTILPNGNVVVTTGLAAGSSNLHVIDPQGNIVWESVSWNGTVGVDSAAVLSSPIIDRQGNIFVSDGDQLWSYTQDGDVRWVTILPSPPSPNPFTPGSRNINSFITATLTNDGSVLGVTMFGQVLVIDGETGAYTSPVYQIPGPLAAAATTSPPPTLWLGGYMDPEIIDPIWQVAYGGIVRSANTPAVDARTGRVIVAATDAVEGLGALYSFDYLPPTPYGEGKISLAWVSQMGPGSGSSPTISDDGRLVYASDNDGFLYAFRTSSGKVVWKVQSNAEAASVAVDPRGNIYVLTRNNVMTSFDDQGDHRWNADVGILLEGMPVSPMWGEPVAIGAGNPTVIKDYVVQDVIVGYNVSLAPIGVPGSVFVPVRASLLAFDPVTGIAQKVLADTTEGTEGILNIAPNGMIYATIGAFTTTSLAPLAPYLNSVLPAGYTVLTPIGGVNGFTPL